MATGRPTTTTTSVQINAQPATAPVQENIATFNFRSPFEPELVQDVPIKLCLSHYSFAISLVIAARDLNLSTLYICVQSPPFGWSLFEDHAPPWHTSAGKYRKFLGKTHFLVVRTNRFNGIGTEVREGLRKREIKQRKEGQSLEA